MTINEKEIYLNKWNTFPRPLNPNSFPDVPPSSPPFLMLCLPFAWNVFQRGTCLIAWRNRPERFGTARFRHGMENGTGL
ncbi:hypothetical protein [uncultured Akkermansia sp.]|uniref:hypothetical protein n=1 Tax=uncultured Akkermansia sp. TaxID=512294 RepID=UPI0025D7E967|nr:hypothetical protein [uncultured Akkermansia sp.]